MDSKSNKVIFFLNNSRILNEYFDRVKENLAFMAYKIILPSSEQLHEISINMLDPLEKEFNEFMFVVAFLDDLIMEKKYRENVEKIIEKITNMGKKIVLVFWLPDLEYNEIFEELIDARYNFFQRFQNVPKWDVSQRFDRLPENVERLSSQEELVEKLNNLQDELIAEKSKMANSLNMPGEKDDSVKMEAVKNEPEQKMTGTIIMDNTETIDLQKKELEFTEVEEKNGELWCPYPAHQNQVPLDQSIDDTFYSCSEKQLCGNPSFRCPANSCGGINRTYAKKCVRCGNEISYNKVYKNYLNNIIISPHSLKKQPFYLNTEGIEVVEVTQILHYLGFLFVAIGKNGILVYNAVHPASGILKKLSFDEKILFIASASEAALLVTTEHCAYRVDIIKDFAITRVMIVDGFIFREVIELAENHFAAFSRNDSHTQLTIYVNSIIVKNFTIEEKISIPLLLSHDSLFFYSRSKIYFYQNEELKTFPVGENIKFNTNIRSRVHGENIFISGEEIPYRLTYTRGMTPVPLLDASIGMHQLSLSNDGSLLYLAHNRGLTIYRAVTGRIEWDMANDPFLRLDAPCVEYPVAEIGNYLMIVYILRQGKTIGFIPKNERNDIVSTEPLRPLLCQPQIVFNRLIIAVKEEYSNKIQVIELCD